MSLRKLLLAVSISLLVSVPLKCLSWGRTGHEITADIALHYLSQPAREQMQELLGSIQPEDAAVWMDEVRISPEYDFMKPWHYIEFAKGASYRSAPADNLLTALSRAVDNLKQTRLDERKRKEALMVILHLIGDMHQPLHTGYPDDKGGNTTQVFFDGNLTSLHHVWDEDIIRSQRITAQSCLELAKSLTPAERDAFEKGDFVNWMEESRALLPQVYDYNGRVADDRYLRRNKAIVEMQLVKAGIRLARVLNSLFIAPPPPPAKNEIINGLTPQQALQHIGEVATVCGKVYGSQFVARTGLTFLDMGGAYPASAFSIVIEAKDKSNFKGALEQLYKDKDICVTGIIRANNGKAVMFVTDEEQIETMPE